MFAMCTGESSGRDEAWETALDRVQANREAGYPAAPEAPVRRSLDGLARVLSEHDGETVEHEPEPNLGPVWRAARERRAAASFRIEWSEDDGEWVATVEGQPSISWLAATPVQALQGLLAVLEADATEG